MIDGPRKPSADRHVKLLLQCRRGNDRAARTLWAIHARSVRACARAMTRDDHAADDIVQRVFCSILETDRRTLRRVRDVRAYLVGAARNEARSHLRGEARRARREQRPRDSGRSRPLPDDAVRNALAAMPEDLRDVLVVRAAGDLTFDQLALALGLNRSTAVSRYRAAIESLRKMLTPSVPEKNPGRHTRGNTNEGTASANKEVRHAR